MKWYFESCRLSHVLALSLAAWVASACFLLKELAPIAYVILHALTTGVFFLAFCAIDRRSQLSEQHHPVDEGKAADAVDQPQRISA